MELTRALQTGLALQMKRNSSDMTALLNSSCYLKVSENVEFEEAQNLAFKMTKTSVTR